MEHKSFIGLGYWLTCYEIPSALASPLYKTPGQSCPYCNNPVCYWTLWIKYSATWLSNTISYLLVLKGLCFVFQQFYLVSFLAMLGQSYFPVFSFCFSIFFFLRLHKLLCVPAERLYKPTSVWQGYLCVFPFVAGEKKKSILCSGKYSDFCWMIQWTLPY